MKKICILFDFILSVFLGYYVNYTITSEIITFFFSGYQQLYIVVFVICLVIQILLFFSLIRLFRNKKMDKFTFSIILILYISIMLVSLFGRQAIGYSINFNPVYLIDFSKENFLQNILNIIFFIPTGYLLRNIRLKKAISFSLVGVISIELIQLLTQRGVFDINDIILNMIGIFIGYYISKKYKLQLINKE